MASVSQNAQIMTVEEYLAFESSSESRHEFFDGQVYAMTGASEAHNLIALNFGSELRSQLRQANSPCKTVVADMKTKTANQFFYPDVMVYCDQNDANEYFKQSPKVIVEVLSNATRKHDETTKFLAYANIPSLEEYVLVEQEFMQVSVLRRSDSWKAVRFLKNDTVVLEALGASISIEDIYYQVELDS